MASAPRQLLRASVDPRSLLPERARIMRHARGRHKVVPVDNPTPARYAGIVRAPTTSGRPLNRTAASTVGGRSPGPANRRGIATRAIRATTRHLGSCTNRTRENPHETLFRSLACRRLRCGPDRPWEADSPCTAIQAGVTLIDDATAKSTATEEYSLDPGFAAGGAPGTAFGQFRVEGEASFKSAPHCAGSPHTNAQRVDAPAFLTMAMDVAP